MLRSIGSVTFLALFMVGCGGGGGSDPPPAHTVNAVVTGLAGSGLVLQDNGGNDLSVAANGAFAFSTRVTSGTPYSVTVLTQPGSPAQTCTVAYGSGTMGSNDVTAVVTCKLNPLNGFVRGPFFYGDISNFGSISGPVAFDGAGAYAGSGVSNTSGVISSSSISGTYTAAVDGMAAFGGYSGAVSADGNTIVSVDLRASSPQAVDVQIKQGQTNFTNADFSGLYQVVSVGSNGDYSSWLTMTADGAGHYSGNLVELNAGAGTSVSGTYGVSAGGAITITPTSGNPLTGGLGADGKTLVLSQLTAGQPAQLAVGIKQGQVHFTNADVVGTYVIVTYAILSAQMDTLIFDGAGIVSGTHSGTYTVAADGTLTVKFLTSCGPHPGGGPCPTTVYNGAVSSDGNTLLLQDPRIANASIGIRL